MKSAVKLCLVFMVMMSVSSFGELLFSDNFNVAGGENWDVNAEYAGGIRQAGTISPVPWLQGHGGVGDADIVGTIADEGPEGAGDGFLTQVDNGAHPDKLLLAAFPGGSYSSVSPGYNFNVDAGGILNYVSISFTVDPIVDSAGTNDQWVCVNIGSGQNDSIVAPQSQFGILFRDNGGFQTFDSGSAGSSGVYSSNPSGVTTHAIELRLYGLVDGNAFDGSGDILIQAWADGSKVHEYTKAGGYLDNYITLGNIGDSSFTISTFDDFSVSVVSGTARVFLVGPEDYILGKRVSLDTELTWAEELSGSLTNPGFDVYMDPNESKVEAMDPTTLVSSRQSTFSYDPTLENGIHYYWRVATYVDITDVDPNQVTGVRSFMTVYDPEAWSDLPWTGDLDSGISAGKVYTHKVNFNASETTSTVVNGVSFENDTNREGSNWILSGAWETYSGATSYVTGDGAALLAGFFYNIPAELILTGLTPGQDYILTQYARGWGNPGGRQVALSTSADGRTTTIDQNMDGDGNGHLFKYAYTAPVSGELVVTFNPLISDTWHHYAFSNEVATSVNLNPSPLPGENVNSDVELSWVLNGTIFNPTYNLKVATDSAMNNLVINEAGLSTTSYMAYLSNDTQYYWQVEVIENGLTVVYASPVWAFNTTPPQPAAKVIEWKFDKFAGTIAEQTGPTTDADGILIGFNDPNTPGISHVAGLINNSLLLNGKDEYVDVSNAEPYMPTNAGQAFSISGYIRTFGDYGPLFSMRNSEDDQPIIDIALGAEGIQDQPGKVCLLVRDDAGSFAAVNSGIPVNDGRWHHIAATRVEGNWKLYVDGVSRVTINGAATGNVSLNMMGIGASLRWLADDWYIERSYYRFFQGLVDEFTVWDGALLPSQMAELAAAVPPQGDLDFDLDTDMDDLADLAGNWQASTWTPVQEPNVMVLEDMESYTNDPNTYKDYWAYVPDEDNYGIVTSLFVVPEPNNVSNQVMRLDYDMNGKLHTHVAFRLLDRRVNSSLYDRLTMHIKKLPGCEFNRLILDFYDGRDNVNPVAEGMYPKGRLEVDFAAAPVDEWVTMDWAIPRTLIFTTCTDLYQIMISFQDGGADTGSVLIDNIELIDGTEDCVPVVGAMVPDMNGDCDVNLLDFVELAQGWLLGIE